MSSTLRRKKSKPVGDPRSVSLTKLDIACEQIRTAVRLFFQDAHPAPIYLLAASAREITTTLGDKLKINTMLTDIANIRGTDRDQLVKNFHRFAGFMKHADRKPNARIDLPYSDVEIVLQVACHDFGRVAGGMPIEAQVYEAWIYAIGFPKVSDAPLRTQPLLKRLIAGFPGVRSAKPAQRRAIGGRVLEEALADPSLEMTFRRTFNLKDE